MAIIAYQKNNPITDALKTHIGDNTPSRAQWAEATTTALQDMQQELIRNMQESDIKQRTLAAMSALIAARIAHDLLLAGTAEAEKAPAEPDDGNEKFRSFDWRITSTIKLMPHPKEAMDALEGGVACTLLLEAKRYEKAQCDTLRRERDAVPASAKEV